MAFINQSNGAYKMSSLVDDLAALNYPCLCHLSVANRYCSPKALRAFIDATRGRPRVADIHLYLPGRTAIAIGRTELHGFKRISHSLIRISNQCRAALSCL